jgi:hypothetical protein
VRQHGLAGHVADGEDIGHAGAHLAIHGDEAAGGLDARDFEADILDVGPAAHGHQDLVRLDVDGTALALDGQHRAVALFDDALGLGAKQDFHAELLCLARDHLHALGIAARQHGGQGFDEGDLAAQLGVQCSDLHADVAGAHHHQASGQFGERQRAGRIDYALAIERQTGDGDRTRARGEDDVLGFHQDLVIGTWPRNAHRARREQGGRAFAVVAAIGLEQLSHPRGQLANHGVFPLLQAAEVDARVVDQDAHLRGVGCFLEQLGRVDERLRRNATHVQAHAAWRGLFHYQDFLAQLAEANAGHVAAWARADDNNFNFQDVCAHERILSIEMGRGGEVVKKPLSRHWGQPGEPSTLAASRRSCCRWPRHPWSRRQCRHHPWAVKPSARHMRDRCRLPLVVEI